MRVIVLKNGEEKLISEKIFKKLEPYFKSGKNGEFELKGQKIQIHDIKDHSPYVDSSFNDALVRKMDEGAKYIKANTPPDYKKEKKDKWIKINLKKFDFYLTPPNPKYYPSIQVKMGENLCTVDRYKELKWLWTGERKKLVEKAKELLPKFYPIKNGAGMAYLSAIKECKVLK